jgi:hypothetical protein
MAGMATNAKCRAELCKTEGLPEPLLTEVFQRLHSVDHLLKIACDYRDDHKGSDTTNKHALKTPAQGRNRGPKPEVSKRVEDAMTKDLQQGKITLADLSEAPKEALATQCDASRDTVRKVRNKIFFGLSTIQIPTNSDHRQIATPGKPVANRP